MASLTTRPEKQQSRMMILVAAALSRTALRSLSYSSELNSGSAHSLPGKPQVQVVPSAGHQAVADEVTPGEDPPPGWPLTSGHGPDQADICLIFQHSAVVLRDDARRPDR